MIAVVRITGNVNLRKDIKETFDRLKIRRKYSCVVLKGTAIEKGMIKKLRDFVAFGEIKKEVLANLIEKRGKLIDKTKKLDVKKIIEGFEKGSKFDNLGIKPYFRLHPPRKGIDTKKHFGVGRGVLGDNKDKINELIERML